MDWLLIGVSLWTIAGALIFAALASCTPRAAGIGALIIILIGGPAIWVAALIAAFKLVTGRKLDNATRYTYRDY